MITQHSTFDTQLLLAAALMLGIWPFGRRKKPVQTEEREPGEDSLGAEASANWAVAINLALLGRHQEALVRFQAMAQDDPQNPSLHYNIGLAHFEMGDFESAVESFKRATELAPERADAHANLGAALHHLSELDAACDAYRQALQLKPDEAAYYYSWGTALMAADDLPGAAEMLGHAYNNEPDDPEYCFNFALCLARLERREDAQRAFHNFLKLSRGRCPDREEWARKYLGE